MAPPRPRSSSAAATLPPSRRTHTEGSSSLLLTATMLPPPPPIPTSPQHQQDLLLILVTSPATTATQRDLRASRYSHRPPARLLTSWGQLWGGVRLSGRSQQRLRLPLRLAARHHHSVLVLQLGKCAQWGCLFEEILLLRLRPRYGLLLLILMRESRGGSK
jgi:hypothetical protein